jgi:hypothetical protein
MAGARPDTVIERLSSIEIKLSLGTPLSVSFGTLTGGKVPKISFVTYAADSGQTTVFTKIDEIALPTAHYWFLSTPFKVDGSPGNEWNARRFLSRVYALLIAHCGLNALVDVVFEGEVDVDGSQWRSTSPVLKTVQPVDGPFLHPTLWEALAEVSAALNKAPMERKQRIELALEFFDRATRSEEEFFNNWTALEILCNGKSQKIRSCLQAAYELPNVGEVDKQSGFKQIAAWRHDFFHKGVRPTISADVARYIQWMFLDLLRRELGLECRRYLGMIQSADGYDLSSIGLADRRTPEQLELIRRAQEQLRPSVPSPQADA